MRILMNILWFVCGGFLSGLGWILAGMLWCLTIVGIPIGMQCFKLAGLSFLSFGAVSPAPEWGLMLSEGRAYMQTAPWLMVFPGLAILITVVIFNMLGDGLRDILDPRHDG